MGLNCRGDPAGSFTAVTKKPSSMLRVRSFSNRTSLDCSTRMSLKSAL